MPGAFGRIEPLHDLRPRPHLRILETVRVRLAAVPGGRRPSSSYLGPFVKLLVYLYPGQPWGAPSLCLSPHSIPKPPAVPPTIAPLSLLESVGASFLPSYWNPKQKVKITKGIGAPEESRFLSYFVHSLSPSAWNSSRLPASFDMLPPSLSPLLAILFLHVLVPSMFPGSMA